MMKYQDFMEYAEANGKPMAADLLLLCGPDGYEGSYEEYEDLERVLNDDIE